MPRIRAHKAPGFSRKVRTCERERPERMVLQKQIFVSSGYTSATTYRTQSVRRCMPTQSTHRYTQIDLNECGIRKWERTCPRIPCFRRCIFVGCTCFRGQTERRPVRSYDRNRARSRCSSRLVYNNERGTWARSVCLRSLIVSHALRGNAAQDAPRPAVR